MKIIAFGKDGGLVFIDNVESLEFKKGSGILGDYDKHFGYNSTGTKMITIHTGYKLDEFLNCIKNLSRQGLLTLPKQK